MASYIALIHKDPDSDFGVSFPDFPGCISAGRSLDEARAGAAEALAFHIEGMTEDGEALPEPSTLEAVMQDPDNRGGVAFLIDIELPEQRAVRVNVTLPENVLKRIDAFTKRAGFSRSAFLARAASHEIDRAEAGEPR